MLLLQLGCSVAMLRPAHSLDKLQGSGNVGVLLDPAFRLDVDGCVDPSASTSCAPPETLPVDLEYRLGLGKGVEIGARGLLPPRALSLKYAFLDERRHRTALSLAVAAEAGGQLSYDGTRIAYSPFVRADVLGSGTLRLASGLQARPVASMGWWAEPRLGDLDHGFGWTAGLFVPIRFPGGLAVSPGAGLSGWVPLHHAPEVYARVGVMVEPWLEPPAAAIPTPR